MLCVLETGDLHYLGRLDNQIQVHGHRVELGEVEAALREALGVDAVVALGWPLTEGGAGGVVAFVAADERRTLPPRVQRSRRVYRTTWSRATCTRYPSCH